MKKYEADIIVVGGGSSGLSSACTAAEQGATVVVFEKGGITGGQANCATGLFAVESSEQRALMEDTLTVEQAFHDFLEYSHYKIDARILRRYIGMSADTIEWLKNTVGVEFCGVYKYAPSEAQRRTWHWVKTPGTDKPVERSMAYCMKALTDYALSMGVQFVFNTEIKSLIKEDGAVVGCRGVNEAGEEIEARGGAVLVGCGGCVANMEMKVAEFGDSIINDGAGFGIPTVTGDGMRMCWDAGANHVHFIHHGGCFVVGLTDLYKTLGEVMHQFNLVVDLNGERIINEWMFTNSVYIYELVSRCKGRQFFMIMNDEILDYYREHGLDIYQMQHGVTTIENWDKELEAYLRGDKADTAMAEMHEGDNRPNGFYVFDTIEEMCAELGINEKNLKKTLERYNSMGFHDDLDFYKPAKFMRPINGGKYYVARYTPFGSDPIGGVKTNENMECLTDDGDVIPGLYSMGNDSNNNYADCYNHNYSGGGNGFAINSGRIAAWEAVKYIQSQEA